jgi:hypothetical protein
MSYSLMQTTLAEAQQLAAAKTAGDKVDALNKELNKSTVRLFIFIVIF